MPTPRLERDYASTAVPCLIMSDEGVEAVAQSFSLIVVHDELQLTAAATSTDTLGKIFQSEITTSRCIGIIEGQFLNLFSTEKDKVMMQRIDNIRQSETGLETTSSHDASEQIRMWHGFCQTRSVDPGFDIFKLYVFLLRAGTEE